MDVYFPQKWEWCSSSHLTFAEKRVIPQNVEICRLRWAWPQSVWRDRENEITPSLFDFIPSLGVLSFTYCCMPDYGWTHQPACVQTCLVCSLLCNTRVPCSQPWLRPSEHVSSSLLQGWCGKYLGKVHTIYKLQMEFLPSRKLAVVGSYIIWWLLSVVKLAQWFIV